MLRPDTCLCQVSDNRRVLDFLRSLLGGPAPAAAKARAPGPAAVEDFPLERHLTWHEGYPILDWTPARAWVDAQPEKRRAAAWSECERAWLLHLRDALGKHFHLQESESAAVLSSLEPNAARAALEYMARTLRRIGAVLKGIVEPESWGKDILILFDDQESYYRYVSHYYPEKGEFATSGGMHINTGCSHYVAITGTLPQLETVIAHEMTHGCLDHLPLPLWLNEGLAVNTEQRLAGAPRPEYGAAERLHERLRRFWSVVSIQEFWSGASFHRPGESNPLSYDLARILVEQLAKDWDPFREFVLHADRADGGAAAAHQHLGLDLGELVTTLLERDTPKSWSPDPTKWEKQ
jgi:hypothetical protein